jgi:GT2 family glycosyltransferase
MARGELLAFLDGDDVWLPQKLERQMAQFDGKPELEVSVTLIQNFWTEELHEEAARLRDHPRAKPLPGYISGTMLTKLDLFKEIGQFDTNYFFADAAEWFLRARKRGTVIELLPEVLVKHRLHPKNLSRREAAASKAEFLAVTKANLEHTRRSKPE